MNLSEIKEKASELTCMAHSSAVKDLAAIVLFLACKVEELGSDRMDEDDPHSKIFEIVKSHVSKLTPGVYTIPDLASGMGLKSEIVAVVTSLRKLEGEKLQGKKLTSEVHGRRRVFKISSCKAA